MDFMSDALKCGRKFRTFNVVDDFNREVLGIEIALNLSSKRVIRTLERIAEWRDYRLHSYLPYKYLFLKSPDVRSYLIH